MMMGLGDSELEMRNTHTPPQNLKSFVRRRHLPVTHGVSTTSPTVMNTTAKRSIGLGFGVKSIMQTINVIYERMSGRVGAQGPTTRASQFNRVLQNTRTNKISISK